MYIKKILSPQLTSNGEIRVWAAVAPLVPPHQSALSIDLLKCYWLKVNKTILV